LARQRIAKTKLDAYKLFLGTERRARADGRNELGLHLPDRGNSFHLVTNPDRSFSRRHGVDRYRTAKCRKRSGHFTVSRLS